MLSGFIIVNKPVGVTSFAMVGLVRRLAGLRRVGHAGTLDPLASGVLPVAVGEATRLIEYMDDAPKAYVARIRFGKATDTYDAEGAVTSTGDASKLTADQIDAALLGFTGEIEQVPPLYSAIKVEGKPLYRYAREGREGEIALKARRVRIDAIIPRSFEDGVSEVEVACGKGTYIRSLAHDLGARLGCGAHLAGLVRTSSGGFTIDETRTPDEIIALAAEERLEEALLAPDRAVERRPAAILDAPHATDVRDGRTLRFEGRFEAELCRAYSSEGAFLGMLRRRAESGWHPEKVLSGARSG